MKISGNIRLIAWLLKDFNLVYAEITGVNDFLCKMKTFRKHERTGRCKFH
jgi:hypothetical protein